MLDIASHLPPMCVEVLTNHREVRELTSMETDRPRAIAPAGESDRRNRNRNRHFSDSLGRPRKIFRNPDFPAIVV
ncbi:hypothetical protein PGTUg99_037242 [Puccinia graminis f. sp. tritici]|uniref:Uncharacterized protein n=1 Tax=Puccinia graminis f. sp. tritici TaxID=56615 RepID=A0A5B0MJJ9_PUCGR|nr:hypothetical protein PGTUg99_037242 [Puccinia graminis f. sp. tritici]